MPLIRPGPLAGLGNTPPRSVTPNARPVFVPIGNSWLSVQITANGSSPGSSTAGTVVPSMQNSPSAMPLFRSNWAISSASSRLPVSERYTRKPSKSWITKSGSKNGLVTSAPVSPASPAVMNALVVPGTSRDGTKITTSSSRKIPRPGASGFGAPVSSRRNGSSATLAKGSTAVTGAASHTIVTWWSPGISSTCGLGGAVGTRKPASNTACTPACAATKLLNSAIG